MQEIVGLIRRTSRTYECTHANDLIPVHNVRSQGVSPAGPQGWPFRPGAVQRRLIMRQDACHQARETLAHWSLLILGRELHDFVVSQPALLRRDHHSALRFAVAALAAAADEALVFPHWRIVHMTTVPSDPRSTVLTSRSFVASWESLFVIKRLQVGHVVFATTARRGGIGLFKSGGPSSRAA